MSAPGTGSGQGGPPLPPSTSGAVRRWLPEITIALTVGLATVVTLAIYVPFGIVTWAFSVIWGIATLSSVALVFAVRRSGIDWQVELRTIFLIGLGLGLISIFTGIGNNATDEPYAIGGAMPYAIGGYLGEFLRGQDPYATHLQLYYTVHVLHIWSNNVSSGSYYTYLPLGLFFQVPGTGPVGFELLCLGTWAGIVYVVRKDEFAAISLSSPVVALLAANGFTDLPVLFLMTLSLRGWTGRKAKAVEYFSYGMKQFANVFWFVYYLLKKQWLNLGLVVGVTFIIVLPFLLWDPLGIGCQALTFSIGPWCAGQPNSARQISDLYSHWNYYLWILWVYVLFRGWIHTTVGRWARAIRLLPASSPSSARTEAKEP